MSSTSPRITLRPNDILCNVMQSMIGRVDDLAAELNQDTTWEKALSHVQELIKGQDRPLLLSHVPTREQKERIKKLAQESRQIDQELNSRQPPRPLAIRNSIPANQLPSPKKASQSERQNLKENYLKERSSEAPYVIFKASSEDRRLACISGNITLSAIDGIPGHHLAVDIRQDNCLWDTGSHYCIITSDLVDRHQPSFLSLGIHDEYRMAGGTGVQVEGVFSMSNATIQISTIFHVLPVSKVPNRRSGIILGQHAFIDRMVVKCVPRSILLKRKEQVDESCWGEIHVESYLDSMDDLHEL